VMLAHPASAGHGLNLQAGGSIIVWYGLPWSLELYQQFNARLHRQGQRHPVRIIHILADVKADKAVKEVLRQKGDTQDLLLKMMDNSKLS
jgi:SNF2 family DNA or RNA helicase